MCCIFSLNSVCLCRVDRTVEQWATTDPRDPSGFPKDGLYAGVVTRRE